MSGPQENINTRQITCEDFKYKFYVCKKRNEIESYPNVADKRCRWFFNIYTNCLNVCNYDGKNCKKYIDTLSPLLNVN
jgi:hypothetical protein